MNGDENSCTTHSSSVAKIAPQDMGALPVRSEIAQPDVQEMLSCRVPYFLTMELHCHSDNASMGRPLSDSPHLPAASVLLPQHLIHATRQASCSSSVFIRPFLYCTRVPTASDISSIELTLET